MSSNIIPMPPRGPSEVALVKVPTVPPNLRAPADHVPTRLPPPRFEPMPPWWRQLFDWCRGAPEPLARRIVRAHVENTGHPPNADLVKR